MINAIRARLKSTHFCCGKLGPCPVARNDIKALLAKVKWLKRERNVMRLAEVERDTQATPADDEVVILALQDSKLFCDFTNENEKLHTVCYMARDALQTLESAYRAQRVEVERLRAVLHDELTRKL